MNLLDMFINEKEKNSTLYNACIIVGIFLGLYLFHHLMLFKGNLIMSIVVIITLLYDLNKIRNNTFRIKEELIEDLDEGILKKLKIEQILQSIVSNLILFIFLKLFVYVIQYFTSFLFTAIMLILLTIVGTLEIKKDTVKSKKYYELLNKVNERSV